MTYRLKLIIGYILSFIIMTAMVAVGVFLLVLATMGSIMFVTWSLPVAPINWWIAVRISIVIGMFVGMCFVFSKEGREMSEEFAKDMWK